MKKFFMYFSSSRCILPLFVLAKGFFGVLFGIQSKLCICLFEIVAPHMVKQLALPGISALVLRREKDSLLPKAEEAPKHPRWCSTCK